MEDRGLERLNDLENFWFNYVDDKTFYPVDCVFTSQELDVLDQYRTDFEGYVKEREALWLRDGGPTDEEWEAYKTELVEKYHMNEILQVYKDAYERYAAVA